MKKSLLLFIQAALCVLSAVALIAAVLMTYFEGVAAKSNNPMADVYSFETIADKAVFVLPIIFVSIIVTVICVALGVKNAETGKVYGDIFIRNNTNGGRELSSTVKIARLVILLLALIFIIMGIFNGSLNDVFIKAAKICTECIGLG